MNPTPDIDAHIDERIARLARGRRDRNARAELKDHVLQAAHDLAGPNGVTRADVNAAFATLGDDATIRATFFPGPPLIPMRTSDIVVLAAASLIVIVGGFIAGVGTASCTASDGGTCSHESSGYVLDLLIMASVPLAVLAARRWLPAWLGLAGSIVYAVFVMLRGSTIVGFSDVVATLTEAVAAVAMLYVTGRHLAQQRRAISASRPTA